MDDSTPVNVVDGKVLHPDLLPGNIKKTSYAVRGELYLRAQELQREGREIIYTNIGNPQALGLKPPRFSRQVLALVMAPFLMEDPNVGSMFPSDAIARAKHITELFKGGVGAYSDSKGNLGIREEVAKFIEKRDGYPSNPEHIFLANGASMAVRLCLEALVRDDRDAILVPIPQYPLYSATLSILGGTLLGYYLDEDKGWGMDLEEIRKQANDARTQGKAVRALAYINPGNPTGQCLTYENVKEIIKFAYDEKVVLLADEVYQENIYQDEHPFVSTKKVLMDMGEPYSQSVELACFHTVSKGTIGECGLRGGYVEFTNVHPDTIAELYKLVSVQLCPNNVGQVAVSLSVNPPKEGDESYSQYKEERESELASMRRRAHMVTNAFNKLDGMRCNFTEGAMYSFPLISLPPKALKAAEESGKAPDVFYCLKLLEATGISTVPGSGFGQKPGTFHLRTTILPREEVVESFCKKFMDFHVEFMSTHA
ncbi:hypothetical protein BSKO_01194 [Bryopsis sp. KO-2023]|nr:hypothetical protein BSKO_01194 [Bryopsis sp. KO-2023]